MARSKLNFLIQFLLYYLAIINLGKQKRIIDLQSECEITISRKQLADTFA